MAQRRGNAVFGWFGPVALTVGLLSGCTEPMVPAPPPNPATATPAVASPADVPALATTSPASAAAHAYYTQVQQALLSQGLMRTDGGGADTAYTDRMLADTFVQIALRDEYVPGSGGSRSSGQANVLRRWSAPVRVALRFGPSVPDAMRATDTARIGSYLARLARVTGHSIRLDDTAPNFFLYVVTEDERRALGPTMQAAMPGLGVRDVMGMTHMAKTTYCAVLAQSRGQSGVYVRAFAVVRAEHPDLLRLSCIHEEVAQGLGLPNDSPRARPSIFNDDEEFALLTGMDEAMLRMLYNPALRPGMTEAEARPIINDLAARMVGGGT